jgi:hypothetical protein
MSNLIDPQPPPKNVGGDVWLLVLEDMAARRDFGLAKYGQPVQVGCGRDALIDAYQEVLDLAVYLRKEIEARKRIPPMPHDAQDVHPSHVMLECHMGTECQKCGLDPGHPMTVHPCGEYPTYANNARKDDGSLMCGCRGLVCKGHPNETIGESS